MQDPITDPFATAKATSPNDVLDPDVGAFASDAAKTEGTQRVLQSPVSREKLERHQNAAQVLVEGLRNDLLDEPGWSVQPLDQVEDPTPGDPGSFTPTSTSSSSSTRQGGPLEVLGQGLAGAGGAIAALVVGVVAAVLWGMRDG